MCGILRLSGVLLLDVAVAEMASELDVVGRCSSPVAAGYSAKHELVASRERFVVQVAQEPMARRTSLLLAD